MRLKTRMEAKIIPDLQGFERRYSIRGRDGDASGSFVGFILPGMQIPRSQTFNLNTDDGEYPWGSYNDYGYQAEQPKTISQYDEGGHPSFMGMTQPMNIKNYSRSFDPDKDEEYHKQLQCSYYNEEEKWNHRDHESYVCNQHRYSEHLN